MKICSGFLVRSATQSVLVVVYHVQGQAKRFVECRQHGRDEAVPSSSKLNHSLAIPNSSSKGALGACSSVPLGLAVDELEDTRIAVMILAHILTPDVDRLLLGVPSLI